MPPMVRGRKVWVRHQVEGWHSWPDAPTGRVYLKERHRHLFKLQASVSVNGNDREIEFHDLLDQVKQLTPQGELGAASCEQLAITVAEGLALKYPERAIVVNVSEDGECGAQVTIA